MSLRSTIALSLILLAIPSSASGAAPLQPGAFQLEAGRGYSLQALSYDGDSRGNDDALVIFLLRKDEGVVYSARKGVEVTETAISADLGAIGAIDVHFVPSGPPKEQTVCGSEPVEYQPGFYEGRIDVEGEEGFTEVHATRARGDSLFLLRLVFCSRDFSEGFGGRAPGAQLSVGRRWSQGSVQFTAWKNSPTRPSRFSASIEERRGDLEITREVGSTAGPGAFTFDVPEQRAFLDPPAPFAGAAQFKGRAGEGPGRLRGSLSVDFPGHSNVSLGGSRGGLKRYVQNPSHPFRPNLSAWPSTKPSPIASATSLLLGPS
ncbi:MAG: hypothetical protein M3Y75_09680 [Actinomycetota bacterium]|nr:hypothetical protein [Actinomycetota bacterium]